MQKRPALPRKPNLHPEPKMATVEKLGRTRGLWKRGAAFKRKLTAPRGLPRAFATLSFSYASGHGFSDWCAPFPHFVSSGVAQWLACWAHNPKVRGSKPRSAMICSQAELTWCRTRAVHPGASRRILRPADSAPAQIASHL